MQSPDLAVRELERCVRELGLSGIQIGSNVNGANLDSPELFPIFEAAASLGAAVFVHPWEVLGRDRMTRYWLPWLVGMPAETSLAICSLIFGAVLERLPALRIALRARRRRLSGDDRANRSRLRRAARPVRRLQRRLAARIPRADLPRLARPRSADAALPRRADGRGSDRPRQRLSLPARRGSAGSADRLVRIPGGDARAAAARHGARVARRPGGTLRARERIVSARARLRRRAGSRATRSRASGTSSTFPGARTARRRSTSPATRWGFSREEPPGYVEEELEKWRRLAVKAHFSGENPWLPYHELLAEPMARLVGAHRPQARS